MKVKVLYDYPTIEGMIYKDTVLIVAESEYNEKIHDEKVKGNSDTGKIVWVPKKLLLGWEINSIQRGIPLLSRNSSV